MRMHSNPVGIDLGTTNSTVAELLGTNVHVFRNADGAECTPSCVYLNEANCFVVGRKAKECCESDPENAFMEFKRAMGSNTEYRFATTGKQAKPEELSAEVLKTLCGDVRRETGGVVSAAVIAVPADFDLPQCEATKRAASLAGIKQTTLLTEPVAAAQAYSFDSQDDRTFWLVYAFGGGTFDAAIIQVRDGLVQITGHGGDNHLGGKNIDWAIVQELMIPAVLRERRLTDFNRGNPKWRGAIAKLKIQAEAAKIRLSSPGRDSTEIQIGYLCNDDDGKPVEFSYELQRADLERLATPFIRKTINICKELLVSRRLEPRSMGKLILVGGPTMMPYLCHILQDTTEGLGIPLEFSVDPLTVVARGAAIFAASQRLPSLGSPPLTTRPKISDENVQFTVFRPQVVVPQKWYPLLAFAHLSERRPDAVPDEPDPLQEVQRQAKEVLGEKLQDYRPVTHDSAESVPKKGELTFVPEVPGFEFNPPRATFLWLEDVHRQEFRLRAPSELEGQTARGRLTVFLGVCILADVPLAIRVSAEVDHPSRPPATATVSARPYRRVFASYSHKDAAVVDQFEQIVNAFGDRYLRDIHTLRAGEVWSDRLADMICEADVFQLFWSNNAMVSSFVRQEWEHALSLRRQHFVRPVYWETPFPENRALHLPPEALRRFHFQTINPPRSWAESRPPFSVTLDYAPVGPDTEPVVAGTVMAEEGVDKDFSGFSIEFINLSAHPPVRNGKVGLDLKGHFLTSVAAKKSIANTFEIELRDSKGAVQCISPNTFTITVKGMCVAADPTLTHAVGLALANNKVAQFFPSGTPLPARQRMDYRTAVSLRKGQTGELLRVPVVEGEKSRADRNRVIGTLRIPAERITRDLPAGSDIEVTIEIDKSRLIRTKAFIPILDEGFEDVIQLESETPDAKELVKRMSETKSRLADVRNLTITSGDLRAQAALQRIDDECLVSEIEKLVGPAATEADAARQCQNALNRLNSALDEVEDALEWLPLVAEAQKRLEHAHELVTHDKHVTENDRQALRTLERDSSHVIRHHNPKLLREHLERLDALIGEIVRRDPSVWVHWFNETKQKRDQMRDATQAQKLFAKGDQAINSNDFPALREAVGGLWVLLPTSERSERISDIML